MNRSKLRTIDTLLKPISTFLDTGPKKVDPHYNSPEHREWRLQVMKRARWRCQAPGCTKRSPEHRLFADHIVELKDGGPPFDPTNGMALCGEHHSLKTAQSRAERHGLEK